MQKFIHIKGHEVKKLSKYVTVILLKLGGLLALIIILILLGTGLREWWVTYTYTHPNEVLGFGVGDESKDLIFKYGKGEQTGTDDYVFYYERGVTFGINSEGKIDWVSFIPGGMTTEYSKYSFPMRTVENLKDKFGEPEIYSSSKDHLERYYTYSGDNLSTGVTYHYKQNRLEKITFGIIHWRSNPEQTGDYIVNGIVFCPGLKCPFTDEGTKPQWRNKSVRDLIKSD